MKSFAERTGSSGTTPFFAPAPGVVQRKTGGTAGLAAPAAGFGLDELRDVLARRYAVADVREGTQAEQAHSVWPAGKITIPGWAGWTPPAGSPVFEAVLEAFRGIAADFGGVPPVRKVLFFAQDYGYDAATGTVTPRPATGAAYGGGELFVFKKVTGDVPLPIARSNAKNTYADEPVVKVLTPGSSPGAPLPLPTSADNARRNVLHELGHGLTEAALGSGTVPATDQKMLSDFRKAVGWKPAPDERLFDLKTGTQITPAHWNDPKWQEQPVSHYAVAGGAPEDFAESVMAYVETPGVLRARSPARYEFIDQRKALWLPNLRRIAPVGDFPLPKGGKTMA